MKTFKFKNREVEVEECRVFVSENLVQVFSAHYLDDETPLTDKELCEFEQCHGDSIMLTRYHVTNDRTS